MLKDDIPNLSIVIPTLNEGAKIGATIDSLKQSIKGYKHEILVVDGGSLDETIKEATSRGAQIILCKAGRGIQLATGGRQARGTWFLFIHADTKLEIGWFQEFENFIANHKKQNCAAAFSYSLDDNTTSSTILEAFVNWRTRKLALPYGDQCLLINRDFYNELNGYAEIPIMEDVEIIRRIGSKRLYILKSSATTSADKYLREGYVLRCLKNLFCLFLYFVGFRASLIAKIYR